MSRIHQPPGHASVPVAWLDFSQHLPSVTTTQHTTHCITSNCSSAWWPSTELNCSDYHI